MFTAAPEFTIMEWFHFPEVWAMRSFAACSWANTSAYAGWGVGRCLWGNTWKRCQCKQRGTLTLLFPYSEGQWHKLSERILYFPIILTFQPRPGRFEVCAELLYRQWITLMKLVYLMDGIHLRDVKWRSSLGLCSPPVQILYFLQLTSHWMIFDFLNLIATRYLPQRYKMVSKKLEKIVYIL